MIKEAIAYIAELVEAQQPPQALPVTDGTGRTWLRDDSVEGHKYTPVPNYPGMNVCVSNIDSFAKLIDAVESLDPIVVLNDTGGVFMPHAGLPDEKGRTYTLTYQRRFTAAWTFLKAATAQPMEQLQLIRTLQGLRPYFASGSYGEVLAGFKKVSFNESTSIEGQPIIENGTARRSISVNVTVKGGTQDASLPGGFTVTLPVANGELFTVEVEVDAFVRSNKIYFTLHVADILFVEEQVREHEVTRLTELVEPTVEILLND